MTLDISALIVKGIEQGGAVIVAVFAIWVLKGVNELRVQEQKNRAEEQKADKETVIEVVKANTAVIAGLTTVIQHNTHVSENCELAQEALRENGK